jgi:hypothetical protein
MKHGLFIHETKWDNQEFEHLGVTLLGLNHQTCFSIGYLYDGFNH